MLAISDKMCYNNISIKIIEEERLEQSGLLCLYGHFLSED